MPDIQSIAPNEMGELTKKFIENKNVNERVSIRLKMKAILDYLSTDTEYPPNPLLKKEAVATPARDMAIAAAPGFGGINVQPYAAVQPLGPVEPIAPRMDNTEILG